MNARFGRNEGFRILDEFVCQAIPDPAALPTGGAGPVSSQGVNEGMLVLEELTFDATRQLPAPEPVDGATVQADQNTDGETQDFRINCPQCSQRLRTSPSMAGKQVRCPKCRAVFSVPA
jgi:hypothetical protein